LNQQQPTWGEPAHVRHAQLARTGLGGAIIIGGTVVTGWWILGIAVVLVVIGAAGVRFGFRRGRTAGQR
jgi:site-specific recombinase